MKTCAKCGQAKILAAYPFRRGEWSGICRECWWEAIRTSDRVFLVTEDGQKLKRKRPGGV